VEGFSVLPFKMGKTVVSYQALKRKKRKGEGVMVRSERSEDSAKAEKEEQ
jgi:hypothetical protein